MENILEIKNLHTYFYTEDSVVKAVEGLNLSVKRNEALGLVGESACGKSVTASSVMRLIQPPGKSVNGEIIFEGNDILKLFQNQMQKIRGKDIAIIFQEPFMALNPVYRIGFQIGEAIGFHQKGVSKETKEKKVIDLLNKVGIPDPKSRLNDYPHNLSGGQAQRVVIAMSLSCEPKLIIADEPTTSLDVTIQAQIMELLLKLKKESNFTFILITHNLALCSEVVDRIAIMYAGRIVELAKTEEIFKNPLHPYTQALFSSIPRGDCIKKKLKVIEGSVADPASKPLGCHFNPRCPKKKDNCLSQYPEYKEISPGHWVSCHYVK
ncbi:MAG: ABC transporter ATP-binding protein [Candidatus Omnitrophica bacterium]|nr:ABC transporter ATP-binding protein [Candidatus Omnitrophota bacterium]